MIYLNFDINSRIGESIDIDLTFIYISWFKEINWELLAECFEYLRVPLYNLAFENHTLSVLRHFQN